MKRRAGRARTVFNAVAAALCVGLGAWLTFGVLHAPLGAGMLAMGLGLGYGFVLFHFPLPNRGVALAGLFVIIGVFLAILSAQQLTGPVQYGWALAAAAGANLGGVRARHARADTPGARQSEDGRPGERRSVREFRDELLGFSRFLSSIGDPYRPEAFVALADDLDAAQTMRDVRRVQRTARSFLRGTVGTLSDGPPYYRNSPRFSFVGSEQDMYVEFEAHMARFRSFAHRIVWV